MFRTTLSKLKKACSSLSLAPRALRGDTRNTPGKFQKLSVTVLRKAEKSTKLGKDKEYEKCKNLIELIFGPSKPPDTIKNSIKKTELLNDQLHNNELHNDKLAEMAVPHVQEHAQCEKHDVVYSEPFGKEDNNKGLLGNSSEVPLKGIKLYATTVKQTEEQLAQKVENISETPLVEAEKPIIDGFNVSPRVLGGTVDARSFQNYESRKFDDFNDTGVRSPSCIDAESFEEQYNMKATVESLVRRIEETRRLEDVRRLEETRRIELMLSNEMERSDFKLPIYNFASDRQSRKSGASAESTSYDELAKRCLDAPSSKIDERLLKEMEKLGVPQTSPRGESSMIEENIIQIEVLKKPRRPVKKTEIDLEAREFQRDPPIAYVDKLHPAFQMANSLKPISDDDSDNITLKSERKQLYELDKKPLTYSEESAAGSEPVVINAQEDSVNFEPRPNYDPSQAIIDPYDKKTIAYDNDEEEYDPLWYQKYSFRQEQKSEQSVGDTPEIESDEAETRIAAQILAAHQMLQNANKSEPFPESHIEQPTEETEPYIAFESHPLEHANERWQYLEQPEPISKPKTSPEEVFARSQPLKSDTTPTEHKTIQLSIQIDPIKPEIPSQENTATERETFHYFTQHETTTIQESNTPKANEALEYYTQSEHSETSEPKHPKETFQFITHPQPTPTPEPNIMKSDKKSFEFHIPETTMPTETSTEKLSKETFHYSTPHGPEHSSESSSIEHADVTYIEPSSSEETEKVIEKKNPNITPEQISHSFVQPQTMVNPLVDSKTLAEPADAIQKTLSAACGPLPNIKPDKDVSLSEMLKRVRMRNRMQICQAYDRQVDPVTGKCGKKTPPCPPPAPKCPPPPPPCPKPCKPACPPPCPPPCPSPCPPKKNPCQKFKKHFPSINLKKIIISLLHQPESDIQKTSSLPSLCGNNLERSRAVWTKEMSLKLQEIGINLLVACPRNSISLTTNLNAENLTLARNFEPWVPIPSWPIPKKEKKGPFVCPKEGCKLIPPPKLRPACDENPCTNSPRRTNSFSITDLFTFSVGDYILFDIID